MFVDGMPETKGSWIGGRGRLRPDNPREQAWATQIGWLARARLRDTPPSTARLSVALRFTLLPPPNRSKKNRRDIDKLARSALDAMSGIVYVDDEQVDRLGIVKVLGAAPGVDILVEELEQ